MPFNQPLRKALGMVQNPLQLAQLYWPVPDFSIVCCHQKTLQVPLSYRLSTAPLHLLVHNTDIKFLVESECKRKKHEPEHRRAWRKVHLGIDAPTLEIRAIEVKGDAIGDAPMLAELLAQIPANESIASVSAHGTYDTRGCLDAIAQRGVQAVIPPRKNASLWKRVSLRSANRNEAVLACKRFGWGLWKVWSDYRQRSLVENKMHCFK